MCLCVGKNGWLFRYFFCVFKMNNREEKTANSAQMIGTKNDLLLFYVWTAEVVRFVVSNKMEIDFPKFLQLDFNSLEIFISCTALEFSFRLRLAVRSFRIQFFVGDFSESKLKSLVMDAAVKCQTDADFFQWFIFLSHTKFSGCNFIHLWTECNSNYFSHFLFQLTF